MAGRLAAWMVFMALFEFVCPHCSGRFDLENPPAGGQAACPLCSRTLAIPELPRGDEETGGAVDDANEIEVGVVGRCDVEAQPVAFDVGELAPLELLSGRHRSKVRQVEPVVKPLSREEKERRRQIRSLAWMIGGAVLLAIAAAVLSRF